MSYSSVTKPNVGDSVKARTIQEIIDNQDVFNSSLSGNKVFNADGDFEATPGSGDPALGWTDGGGAATIARSSASGDPNSSGQYCLKFTGGSASDSNYIESDIFPIDAEQVYKLAFVSKVDDAGDEFKVEFISYQRDGTTGPVQTVANPRFKDTNGNYGFNFTSGMVRREWLVDGGANGRWAKIKISWTCNSSAASAGYADKFEITPANNQIYRFLADDFNAQSNHELDIYCPRNYQTMFLMLDDTHHQITSYKPSSTSHPAVQSVAFSDANYGATAGAGLPFTLEAAVVCPIVSSKYNSNDLGTTVTVNTSSQQSSLASNSKSGVGVYYVPSSIF